MLNAAGNIEESLQAAKTGLGLDQRQHQQRRWKAWHRWTTLVIAAHAFLAAATTVCTPSLDGLIAVTVNELRRLFHALVIEPARRTADVIAWSIYRRRQQDQPLRPPSPPNPETDLLLEY